MILITQLPRCAIARRSSKELAAREEAADVVKLKSRIEVPEKENAGLVKKANRTKKRRRSDNAQQQRRQLMAVENTCAVAKKVKA